ncbi:SDR family oxidoreductase [Mycolicibacterium farcinogenes]|nr:SDR family oxidoreductase [Mycolicibacterium farcinogenes]
MAVVIGGASGIGWATARALATDGYRVVIADRDFDGAQEKSAELGEPHQAVAVDVTDEGTVASLFEGTGAIDVVVNTAGFGDYGRIVDMETERFRAVVDVCLIGAFVVTKYAGRYLNPGGSLVSIASLNARLAAAGVSSYCSAKAGLAMLTQVAALELAPNKVRVNAVSPGLVMTPLTELVAQVPGAFEEFLENTPIGRVGTPEDVADAVSFLCSDKASWLTGVVLDLNGGAHLMRYPDVLGRIDAMVAGTTAGQPQ